MAMIPIESQGNPKPTHIKILVSYIVEVVHSPMVGLPEPLKTHYSNTTSIADRTSPNHETQIEEPVILRDAFIMLILDIAL